MERCERHAFDEAWEMLSNAYKGAFLKQKSDKINATTRQENEGNRGLYKNSCAKIRRQDSWAKSMCRPG